MPALELLILASMLFGLFSLVLMPAGWLIASCQPLNAPYSLRVLLSFGLGSLTYALLFIVMFMLGGGQVAQILLFFLVFLCLFFFLKKGGGRDVLQCRHAIAFWFVYYLLVVFSAAFPVGDYRDVLTQTVGLLSGLPVDNMIPYNFSRYLLEHISFDSVEVVKDWAATDRGPLTGILNALFFNLLGIKESAHWMQASKGAYFVYHCLSVYLNSLSLLAVWLITEGLSGRRASVMASIGLTSTYFFFINVFFSWPKFFMAYFILGAFAVFLCVGSQQREGNTLDKIAGGAALGLMFAGAVLSHEIAWWSLASFAVIVGGLEILKMVTRKEQSVLLPGSQLLKSGVGLLAFFMILAPWGLVKLLYSSGGNRLLYLHLFCFKGQDISQLSLSSAFAQFMSENSLGDLLAVRVNNLLYPFNIFHPISALRGHWDSLYAVSGVLAPLSFYQLVYALGPLFLLLLMFSMFLAVRLKEIRLLLALSYGGLVPAVILFGCPLSTWNHTWAYVPFLCSMVAAASVLEKVRPWASVVFCLGVGFNALLLVMNFWFLSKANVYLHASRGFLVVQSALFVFLYVFAALGLKSDAQEGRQGGGKSEE